MNLDKTNVEAGLGLYPVCPEGEWQSKLEEFFVAGIRNGYTRKAYWAAANRFASWCERQGQSWDRVEAREVGRYVDELCGEMAAPSVRQHLAGLRTMFDWMVRGGLRAYNPVASVRGPRHVVRRGKTPALSVSQMGDLLRTLRGDGGLAARRDEAIVSVMAYSFARVGAVVGLRREDYVWEAGQRWFRLREKNGKVHTVPAHTQAAEAVERWLEVLGPGERDEPLFRSLTGQGAITGNGMSPNDVLRMVKRRAKTCGLGAEICCHSFRATGITRYLAGGGTLERAQTLAAHSSPRTTQLYDRSTDVAWSAEVERIRFC